MSPTNVKRWPFWCWFPWILIIIIVIWCWWPKPVQDDFDADLIIQDETTAAWATTNNTFAGGTPNPEVPRSYWTGLLVQLGRAEPSERKFKAVEFYAGGSLQGELRWDAVTWINIVAAVPDLDEPMLIDDFPRIDGSCQEVDGCTRCRRLHALLDPSTVLTYWQGPKGIAIEASQSTGSFSASNEQRFDFRDEYKVTCYHRSGTGGLEVIAGFVFDVGQIDEIRVTFEPTDPGGGVKQDPPWPGP